MVAWIDRSKPCDVHDWITTTMYESVRAADVDICKSSKASFA